MNVAGSLYINSNDRNAVTYDYNEASYQLPSIQYLSMVALSSYDFVYGLNNINVNNHIGYFETSTQSFAVSIATGNYDYTTLAAAILVALNALGLGVFTLTYTNDIYTLTSPVPIRFINNPISNYRTWVDMLALKKNTITLQTVFVGGVPNLAYTDLIYIISDELHRRQTVRDTSTNNQVNSVLGVVYVNRDRKMNKDEVMHEIVEPKHITERIRVPKYTYMDINYRINTVSIRLLDQQGLPLPPTSAGNGSCEYTLELLCFNQNAIGT